MAAPISDHRTQAFELAFLKRAKMVPLHGTLWSGLGCVGLQEIHFCNQVRIK
jgi:hypothetical protein